MVSECLQQKSSSEGKATKDCNTLEHFQRLLRWLCGGKPARMLCQRLPSLRWVFLFCRSSQQWTAPTAWLLALAQVHWMCLGSNEFYFQTFFTIFPATFQASSAISCLRLKGGISEGSALLALLNTRCLFFWGALLEEQAG